MAAPITSIAALRLRGVVALIKKMPHRWAMRDHRPSGGCTRRSSALPGHLAGASLVLAFLFAAGLASADARRSYVNVPHQEGRIEIRSYGERSRDLLALLVPFLSRSEFSQVTWTPVGGDKEGSGIFARPNGDYVATAGRYNCLIVAYSSTLSGVGKDGITATERFNRFRSAVRDFLAGLPAPRPVPRDVEWGKKSCLDSN